MMIYDFKRRPYEFNHIARIAVAAPTNPAKRLVNPEAGTIADHI